MKHKAMRITIFVLVVFGALTTLAGGEPYLYLKRPEEQASVADRSTANHWGLLIYFLATFSIICLNGPEHTRSSPLSSEV